MVVLLRKLSRRFRAARLRTQLVVVINVCLAMLVAAFVVMDYRSEVLSKIRDKETALVDEARTIEAAVRALRARGHDAVQNFIEESCTMMNARESPGHTIEVTIDNHKLLADPMTHGHDYASESDQMIWGASGEAALRVRVGERRGPVLAVARRDELSRVGAVVLVAGVGVAILNFLLSRLVTQPIKRLADTVHEIGDGRLGTTVDINANREMSDLAESVSRMSLELARRDADRGAQLERARRLQSHLIPTQAGNAAHSIAIEYHPAGQIAGDFVDVIACSNGDTLLCVADVVGHGIHAAMGAAVLKALLLASDRSEPSPAKILSQINRQYWAASLPEDFATMVLVRVSGATGAALYASAGHEVGFIRRANGQCEPVSSTGLVLGVEPDAVCSDTEFTLPPGDLLVLISDGVTETQDEQGRLLGRSRVAKLISEGSAPSASSLARQIVEEADRHRGGSVRRDDVTVLALASESIDEESLTGTHCDSNSTPVLHDQHEPSGRIGLDASDPPTWKE